VLNPKVGWRVLGRIHTPLLKVLEKGLRNKNVNIANRCERDDLLTSDLVLTFDLVLTVF
jgi:hypothetical protein